MELYKLTYIDKDSYIAVYTFVLEMPTQSGTPIGRKLEKVELNLN